MTPFAGFSAYLGYDSLEMSTVEYQELAWSFFFLSHYSSNYTAKQGGEGMTGIR